MLHFRTSDNKEVDFVIEKPNGQLAAVEVKKRDTIEQSDCKGIQQLGELAGKNFITGLALYRGKQVVPTLNSPFGPQKITIFDTLATQFHAICRLNAGGTGL